MDAATHRRLVDEARTLGVEVDDAVVQAHLGPILARSADPGALHLGDLYLAQACALGENTAMRRFETLHGPDFDRAIARSSRLGVSAPEFRQRVLDHLFVAKPGAAPRITQYQGRGPLQGWLRVMTSRLVIDLSRARKRPESEGGDALVARMADAQDTELAYLRHAFGPALERAFSQGLAGLDVRQRNLLRQRYLHDVSAGALAKIYGVHRATMFGWLDKARDALLLGVREALAHAMPGDGFESVVGMLGSALHLSVRRLLDSQLEPDPDPDAKPQP